MSQQHPSLSPLSLSALSLRFMHVATTPTSQSSLTFRSLSLSLSLSLYFLHVATTPNSQCTSISRHFSIPWILQQNSFLQCVYPLNTSTKSIPSLHPFYNPFFLLTGEGTYFQPPIFLSLSLRPQSRRPNITTHLQNT